MTTGNITLLIIINDLRSIVGIANRVRCHISRSRQANPRCTGTITLTIIPVNLLLLDLLTGITHRYPIAINPSGGTILSVSIFTTAIARVDINRLVIIITGITATRRRACRATGISANTTTTGATCTTVRGEGASNITGNRAACGNTAIRAAIKSGFAITVDNRWWAAAITNALRVIWGNTTIIIVTARNITSNKSSFFGYLYLAFLFVLSRIIGDTTAWNTNIAFGRNTTVVIGNIAT